MACNASCTMQIRKKNVIQCSSLSSVTLHNNWIYITFICPLAEKFVYLHYLLAVQYVELLGRKNENPKEKTNNLDRWSHNIKCLFVNNNYFIYVPTWFSIAANWEHLKQVVIVRTSYRNLVLLSKFYHLGLNFEIGKRKKTSLKCLSKFLLHFRLIAVFKIRKK